MRNAYPELADYVDGFGDPSAEVLAEARSSLSRTVGSPESLEQPPESVDGPGRLSRWKTWTVLAAAAVATVAAVAAPLALRSSHPTQPTGTTSPSHISPLADLAATPKGWSPVAFGNLQISVPASWFVEEGGFACGGGVAGMVFVPGASPLRSVTGCSPPTDIISFQVADNTPLPHARTASVNGLRVEVGWTRRASTVTYVERALGLDVSASGPLAQEVLRTATYSPLSVVLDSTVNDTAAGWRTEVFGGLQLTVPSSWQVTRDSWWGGCPFNIDTNVLRLSTAQTESTPVCPLPPTNAGYVAGVAGMVVGAGPQVQADDVNADRCLRRNDLRICIEPAPGNGGFETGRQLGLLTAEVFVPGQARPDQVEIGLAGSGLTPLQIFDSLRPSGG